MTENCDCECKGVDRYTPVAIYNPAGLPSLAYRVGTHGRFKAQMLADITSKATLGKLTTREESDLSIALFDSWATIADVLSFYQERIANEGFLRTATERRSVLELARSISYELRPGVAASAYLAFTMEDSTGSPQTATVDLGTKVQSVPGQNELPKMFETVEEIKARREWSMLPKQKEKQDVFQALQTGNVYFEGTATKLKVGDGLLFVASGKPVAFRIVQEIDVEAEMNRTHVAIPALAVPGSTEEETDDSSDGEGVIDADTEFTRNDLDRIIGENSWTESALQAEAELQGWSVDVIVDAVNSEAKKERETENGVYAFRTKCGVFGNSAPLWASLPPEQRFSYTPDGFTNPVDPPYPEDWDANPVDVNTDYKLDSYGTGKIYLDNAYPGILPDGWLVLHNSATEIKVEDRTRKDDVSADTDAISRDTRERSDDAETTGKTYPSKITAYKVNAAGDKSMTGFSLTAKVTSLTLDSKAWQNVDAAPTEGGLDLDDFYFRSTSVYALPEKLELSEISIADPVEGREIVLDRMVGWLEEGKPIAISGELEGQPGVTRSEIAFIESVVHYTAEAQTRITLSADLEYRYKVDKTKLNANVAEATHGETKEESIGSGDPTKHFQKFTLKKSPLTHVTASTPTGTKDTLEIKIDGVEWRDAESFEDLTGTDKAYVARRSNDGITGVIFGDGATGRLPPSGVENIKARYRVGLGAEGNVPADKLSLLMKRPLGIRSVTNPLKATGGTDPEELEDARKNAPRTVLTMDRIVSLRDYKNFAQGFAGVGKATSYTVRIGGAYVVLVAIASSSGEAMVESDQVYIDIIAAIESYKDPSSRFIVRSFRQRLFKVKANLLVSSDREFEDVAEAARDAIKEAFSFENRDFGQPVAMSEVVSVMQRVEGVEAVDVDLLYDNEVGPKEPPLQIIIARPEEQEGIPVPALLLVDHGGIELGEMAP